MRKPPPLISLLMLISVIVLSTLHWVNGTAAGARSQLQIRLWPANRPAKAGSLAHLPFITAQVASSPTANLLTNPGFEDGFNGWNMVNGYWLLHGPLCYPESPPEFAEMDQDASGGWQVGQEDWLWQDVTAPAQHTHLKLTLTEAHHMHSGQAEIRIYGSQNGAAWEEVFFRPGPEAAFGTGHLCSPAETFSYTIPAAYPFYRFEIYGRMNQQEDGWLIGKLVLQVQ